MAKSKILSVDDDEDFQFVLATYLEGEGHTVTKAFTGNQLEKLLGQGVSDIDVILLDLTLPDAEGFSLIPKIRNHTHAPIIIISGKKDTTEKIVGLEMGADDYLTKPFELRELAARIKAVVRRVADVTQPPFQQQQESKSREVIRFDGWKLDRRQYQAFGKNGQSAELTAGEFRLLEALVMAPNRVLTRDYLFELTRESEFDLSDRAVDIQVARIRKKLGDDPRRPTIIKTVRGVGYMFCGQPSAA